MEYADLIIGVACTIVGVLLSYAAFARNAKKDSEASGKESGTVLTEIGYIKGGVDRIERKQDEQDARYITMAERVTASRAPRNRLTSVSTGSRGTRTTVFRRRFIMSSGKRVAKTDGKLKKAAGAVWSFVKGYLSFSKLLVFAVLFIDYKATMVTLDLCYIAVANNYTGASRT